MSEREGRRARRPTGAENKHTAPRKLDLLLERAQYADIVGVAAVKRTITPHPYGVYRADLCGQRMAVPQVPEHFLLVRQRDAKSPNAPLANGTQKVMQIPYQKGQIYRVCFPRDEPRVVQQGRQRMSDGIADYAEDLRLASEFVRAIEVLQ